MAVEWLEQASGHAGNTLQQLSSIFLSIFINKGGFLFILYTLFILIIMYTHTQIPVETSTHTHTNTHG